MRANRFEQGLISCMQIVTAGVLLCIGFYIGTKIAQRMKIKSKRDVQKYKGVGYSAQKFAHEHLGVKNILIG